MTFRGREDTFSATSEAYSPYSPPGSVLFSKPSDVDYWCQSQQLPPTPESSGDSGLSPDFSQDFPLDMSSLYDWTQTTSSDEIWSVTSMADDRKQLPTDGWPSQAVTSKQETSVSDNATWLTASHGSVAGVSPVLSHMSQNSHTLNSHGADFFPEFFLPSGDQYSMTGDFSQWTAPDNLTHGPFLSQDNCSSLSADIASDSLPVCVPEQTLTTCAPQLSVSYLPVGEVKRSFSEPNVAQGRRLLPRTPQAPALSRSQSGSQYRVIQPQLSPSERVDSKDMVGSTSAPRQGPVDSHPSSGNTLDTCSMAPSYDASYTMELPAPMIGPAMVPDVYQQVPTLDNFPYYAMSPSMTRSLSHMSAYDTMQPLPLGIASGNVQAPMIKLDPGFRVTTLSNNSPTEGDEGRYRTDPLYKNSPHHADGLYHCPFATKPGQECLHKPTKLKCNYDKYIDSHLKPFRCKDAGCAKQHFSSMACVLRHEREAHGLHGHGERPFPCQYAGCERALPHNGFPRKYNLCDHMRRVHGWKDEAAEDQENAAGATGPAGKKAHGRKRKASSSTNGSEMPSARKVKGAAAT